MRLWHKDLIEVLPRKQLVSQWRECCAIASRLAKDGTPNHLLVNKVTQYSPDEFVSYSWEVMEELTKRGYNVSNKSWNAFLCNMLKYSKQDFLSINIDKSYIFIGWHNDIYFDICYYNLLEKYLCDGISEEEFKSIKLLKKWR